MHQIRHTHSGHGFVQKMFAPGKGAAQGLDLAEAMATAKAVESGAMTLVASASAVVALAVFVWELISYFEDSGILESEISNQFILMKDGQYLICLTYSNLNHLTK